MPQTIQYQLRRASKQDAHLLWEWANDPVVRGQAFHPAPIPWETHEQWLDSRLESPTCLMAILETATGMPVGQIRFDQVAEGVEVDLSVAAAHRGQGLGHDLLRHGLEEARTRWPAGTRVIAKVLRDNARSMWVFERCGFLSRGLRFSQGKSYHYLERML